MSLPLSVFIGTDHYTHRQSGLTFRKEAVGGCVSIGTTLIHPLDRTDIRHFDTVTVCDTRTADVIATAQVVDPGRSVSNEGQRWALTAQGPAVHAQDQQLPLVYITQSLESFRQVDRNNRGWSADVSTKPDDSSDGAPDGLLFHAPEGTTATAGNSATLRFDLVRDCDQYLGRISFDVDGGSIDTDYDLKLQSSVDGAGGSVHYTFSLSTAASTGNAEVVSTDFANGRNVFSFFLTRSSGTGKPSTDNKWAFVYNLIVRTRLMDETGADITAGASYGNDYVLAHEVVKDLLGRCLPEFDGPDAEIDEGAAFHIDSLTYPDGVTPAQVLDDLMAFEKAYRWHVTPAGQFRWEPWPTMVRYEATLEDGGDFPAAGQTLYNEVRARYRDKRGRTRSVTRTAAGVGVDDLYLAPAGKVRSALLDLGDEVGTNAGAGRRAENFLATHAAPANTGTLTIARPIRDLISGRMVDPWEIEPGELIRVNGVESYADALNADDRDGVAVFRIWAMDYASDSNAATLELDTYPRNVYGALKRLIERRKPKR